MCCSSTMMQKKLTTPCTCTCTPHIYDLRKTRILRLKPEFERLTLDPYVPAELQRKHVARYSAATAASVGDASIDDVLYPRFRPRDQRPIADAVKAFVAANADVVRPEQEVLVQAQRVVVSGNNNNNNNPSKWSRYGGVNRVGIVCISRENVIGGTNEFRWSGVDSTDDDNTQLSWTLEEGQMVVFDDLAIEHRMTPLVSLDGRSDGHRDVLLMLLLSLPSSNRRRMLRPCYSPLSSIRDTDVINTLI